MREKLTWQNATQMEQRFRQMRFRSGTEQDDFRAAFLQQAVEGFERVTGTDQQQA